MQIKKLENELSEYVSEWLDARWQHWSFVYTSIHRDRRTGIYRLKQGEKLLDYLNSIMGIIEDHLGMDKEQHLIPSKFSSIISINSLSFFRISLNISETTIILLR